MSDDNSSVDKKVVNTERGYEITLHTQRGTGVRDQDEVTTSYKADGRPPDSAIHELLTKHKYCLETVRQCNPDQEQANDEDSR